MTLRNFLYCGVAMASFAVAPAQAATINLIDLGGVSGSQAARGFQIAANYWGAMLTNNATINLGVKFAALAPNIIGSTGSTRQDISIANWAQLVNATKSSSALDQSIVLPTLNGAGGISYVTNGVTQSGNDTALTQRFIGGTSAASKTLWENTALLKAIGANVADPNALDGSVTFSSNFAFDFDPTDGITGTQMDFIGVAIHEIGHALGFVSGVDLLDYYSGSKGPGRNSLGYSFNDTSIYSALDMFRFSDDPNNLNPSAGPTLDLSTGGVKYFSIDGGATALFGNTFSTGAYNGDGRQASHWKDTPACQVGNGIMDPTFCYGQMGDITALDVAAFDAMGWNLSVNALAGQYNITSKQIFQYYGGVPEPTSWALMLAGFGLMGTAIRRQRRTTTAQAA